MHQKMLNRSPWHRLTVDGKGSTNPTTYVSNIAWCLEPNKAWVSWPLYICARMHKRHYKHEIWIPHFKKLISVWSLTTHNLHSNTFNFPYTSLVYKNLSHSISSIAAPMATLTQKNVKYVWMMYKKNLLKHWRRICTKHLSLL